MLKGVNINLVVMDSNLIINVFFKYNNERQNWKITLLFGCYSRTTHFSVLCNRDI